MSALETLDGDAFEEQRSLLFGVAYRLLGSAAEAEDVVQDAYLRYRTARPVEIRSPRAYLVTIVTRLAMDVLRSARVRREQYTGQWLPEPLLTTDGRGPGSPEWIVEQDESLSMALLFMLERLSPVERAVFVLREVFDYDYQEIADIVRKSPAACRQVFRRAKQHLGEFSAGSHAAPADGMAVLGRFRDALSEGDVAAAMDLIAPDATAIGDGGDAFAAGRVPVRGSDKVARLMVGLAAKFGPGTSWDWTFELGEANGSPAFVSRDRSGKITSVSVLEVEHGKVARLFSVVNPDKLRHL